MPGDGHRGPLGQPEVVEVDRLGQLDDLAIGEAFEQPLPKLLVPGPQVSEVPAAVDEDRAGRNGRAQGRFVEVRDGGHVARLAVRVEPEVLGGAEPDGGIADVRVVREIHQRE